MTPEDATTARKRKAAPTKKGATTGAKKAAAKKATKRAAHDSGDGQLPKLIEDLRGALDELALQVDLAGMEGRDALHRRAEEVEARWTALTRRIGYRRIDINAGVEAVKTAFARAEETLRSLLESDDSSRSE